MELDGQGASEYADVVPGAYLHLSVKDTGAGIPPDIPIVLCTGYSDQVTEESALSLGIGAFIIKPPQPASAG